MKADEQQLLVFKNIISQQDKKIHKLQDRVNQQSIKIRTYELRLKEPKVVTVKAISSHAIERFQQRVINWPEKQIRKTLLEDPILNNLYANSNRNFIMYRGYIKLVIKDRVIITVYSDKPPITLESLSFEYRFKELAAYIQFITSLRIKSALCGRVIHIPSFDTYVLNKYHL